MNYIAKQRILKKKTGLYSKTHTHTHLSNNWIQFVHMLCVSYLTCCYIKGNRSLLSWRKSTPELILYVQSNSYLNAFIRAPFTRECIYLLTYLFFGNAHFSYFYFNLLHAKWVSLQTVKLYSFYVILVVLIWRLSAWYTNVGAEHVRVLSSI